MENEESVKNEESFWLKDFLSSEIPLFLKEIEERYSFEYSRSMWNSGRFGKNGNGTYSNSEFVFSIVPCLSGLYELLRKDLLEEFKEGIVRDRFWLERFRKSFFVFEKMEEGYFRERCFGLERDSEFVFHREVLFMEMGLRGIFREEILECVSFWLEECLGKRLGLLDVLKPVSRENCVISLLDVF